MKIRLNKVISAKLLKKKRGQLNIIEVVLAATILLVLSVSIAQVGVKIAESNTQSQDSLLANLPDEVLRNSDNLGYLRPFIYSNIQTNLLLYLNDAIPIGTFYWLYESSGNCLKNSQLDCSDLFSISTETHSSNLYLSGYLTNNTPLIAILVISSDL